MSSEEPISGFVWLIHPVSPALDHFALAERLGFDGVAGFVSPNVVDDPRRLVLVMREPDNQMESAVKGRLKSSKWVSGFRREEWSVDGYPYDDPDFKIHPLNREEVQAATASIGTGAEVIFSGHPFDHSSRLPEWD